MRNAATLLVPVALLLAQDTRAQIDPEVAKLVGPVLEALCAFSAGGYSEEKVESLGRRLAALEDNAGAAADEACVILLDYQLTGAYAEDLVENIDRRGDEVVPFLRKYRASPTWGMFTSQTCPDARRISLFGREDDFLWLTQRLDKVPFAVSWQVTPRLTARAIASDFLAAGQVPEQRLDVVSPKGSVIYFIDGKRLLSLTPFVIGPSEEQLLLAEWAAGPKRSVVRALRYLPGHASEPREADGRIMEVGALPSSGARASLIDVDGDGYPEIVTFEPVKGGTRPGKCTSLVATAHRWAGTGFIAIGQACQEDIGKLFQNKPHTAAPVP